MSNSACSHLWIDPRVPPIQRRPVSPVIGNGHREMQVGKEYRCINCGHRLIARPETTGKDATA